MKTTDQAVNDAREAAAKEAEEAEFKCIAVEIRRGRTSRIYASVNAVRAAINSFVKDYEELAFSYRALQTKHQVGEKARDLLIQEHEQKCKVSEQEAEHWRNEVHRLCAPTMDGDKVTPERLFLIAKTLLPGTVCVVRGPTTCSYACTTVPRYDDTNWIFPATDTMNLGTNVDWGDRPVAKCIFPDPPTSSLQVDDFVMTIPSCIWPHPGRIKAIINSEIAVVERIGSPFYGWLTNVGSKPWKLLSLTQLRRATTSEMERAKRILKEECPV